MMLFSFFWRLCFSRKSTKFLKMVYFFLIREILYEAKLDRNFLVHTNKKLEMAPVYVKGGAWSNIEGEFSFISVFLGTFPLTYCSR